MVSPDTVVEPGSSGSSLTESHHGLGTGQEPYPHGTLIPPQLWDFRPFCHLHAGKPRPKHTAVSNCSVGANCGASVVTTP